jgi:hypothetical protein
MMLNIVPLDGAKWYQPERWVRVGAIFWHRHQGWLRPVLICGLAAFIVFVIIPGTLAILI